MKEIKNNYLIFSKQNEFNTIVLKYFYERVQLFLCRVGYKEPPKLLFTSKEHKIREHIQDEILCRAFYNEDNDVIVFNANRYNWKSDEFNFNREEILANLELDKIGNYKYIMPLSDIYHEVIHYFQN